MVISEKCLDGLSTVETTTSELARSVDPPAYGSLESSAMRMKEEPGASVDWNGRRDYQNALPTRGTDEELPGD